jgi:hypothetical protein
MKFLKPMTERFTPSSEPFRIGLITVEDISILLLFARLIYKHRVIYKGSSYEIKEERLRE